MTTRETSRMMAVRGTAQRMAGRKTVTMTTRKTAQMMAARKTRMMAAREIATMTTKIGKPWFSPTPTRHPTPGRSFPALEVPHRRRLERGRLVYPNRGRWYHPTEDPRSGSFAVPRRLGPELINSSRSLSSRRRMMGHPLLKSTNQPRLHPSCGPALGQGARRTTTDSWCTSIRPRYQKMEGHWERERERQETPENMQPMGLLRGVDDSPSTGGQSHNERGYTSRYLEVQVWKAHLANICFIFQCGS